VVVRTSYFPNWKATNADGPYRVAPNLMVVVPTGNHVTLRYGRTGVDWLGIGLTLLGIVLAFVLARRRLAIRPRPPREDVAEEETTPPSIWFDDELTTVGGSADDEHRAPPPD
jgi:hypothetical protein